MIETAQTVTRFPCHSDAEALHLWISGCEKLVVRESRDWENESVITFFLITTDESLTMDAAITYC